MYRLLLVVLLVPGCQDGLSGPLATDDALVVAPDGRVDLGVGLLDLALTDDAAMLDGAMMDAAPLDADTRWETRLSTVELPKVVIAVDYSGSMTAPFEPDGLERVDVLRQVVDGILDLQLLVEVGLVVYDRAAFASVPISYDPVHAAVREALLVMPSGTTNHFAGLQSAHRLLEDRGAERGTIVLFADGPSTEGPDPVEAATAARDAGYAIFGYFFARAWPQLAELVGDRDNPGHPSFFAWVESVDETVSMVAQVFRPITCAMGPVDAAPEDPRDVELVMEFEDGRDVPLPQVPLRELGDVGVYAAYFDAERPQVRLSEAACRDVVGAGATVVVRGR